MQKTIKIGERLIGPGHPVFVIAELSANHNQCFERAVKLIQAAKLAGADAVKLQTFTADTITIDCDAEPFQIRQGTVWDGQTLHELYQSAQTPWEWQPELKLIAESLGMELFSSPFDESAVRFLQQMDVPAYKIASFEMVDTRLLELVAKSGRPVIVSTGLATLEEIDRAVETLELHGCESIALLKCTSAYPAPAASMNLKTISDLKNRFGVPVGLSDHTLGIESAVASVAIGASIIEKHLTLSRSQPGPDASFSLEPAEFKQLVNSVRSTEAALGNVHYGPTEFDAQNRAFRRSLFVVEFVAAGEVFTHANVRSIRPGHGLQPRFLHEIIGKTASRPILRGTPLSRSDIAEATTSNVRSA